MAHVVRDRDKDTKCGHRPGAEIWNGSVSRGELAGLAPPGRQMRRPLLHIVGPSPDRQLLWVSQMSPVYCVSEWMLLAAAQTVELRRFAAPLQDRSLCRQFLSSVPAAAHLPWPRPDGRAHRIKQRCEVGSMCSRSRHRTRTSRSRGPTHAHCQAFFVASVGSTSPTTLVDSGPRRKRHYLRRHSNFSRHFPEWPENGRSSFHCMNFRLTPTMN